MSAGEEQKSGVSYRAASGHAASLTHEVPILIVRLNIDPRIAASSDDRYTLYSSDGSYREARTVKDDLVSGDEFVDLVFDNLKLSLKYTLEIDPGAEGQAYNLFENRSYQDLIDYYSILESGDWLEDSTEESEPSETSDDGGGGSDAGWASEPRLETIDSSKKFSPDEPPQIEPEVDASDEDDPDAGVVRNDLW